MDVVDEFPNIAVAGLAASSYQDCLPLLAPGRVEHNLSQVLLPWYLCHVRNSSLRSRQPKQGGLGWAAAYLLFHLAGRSLPLLRCGIVHLSVGPVWVQHQRRPRDEPPFPDHS